jgi:TldD protein
MPQRITIDLLDRLRDHVVALVSEDARHLPALRYADVRLEASEGQVAAVENGTDKFSTRDYGLSLGVRVLAGSRAIAPGYFGQLLGDADLDRLDRVLRDALRHAHQRALANAHQKALARRELGTLGPALADTVLAPVPVHQAVVPARYVIDPRTVPLDEVLALARETSRAVQGLGPSIAYNAVSVLTGLDRQLFASSEGAVIDQTWALSEAFAYVVAVGDQGSCDLYDSLGHQRGWEVMVQGCDEGSIVFPDLRTFALNLARDTIALANAPELPSTDHEVPVVLDPHFTALVAHEVIGHPSELDRALKMETAYAGRCWFLKTLDENVIGQRVGSPLLTAYSDPTLEGYGHYLYDDEGTPARRVVHIENGIYREFLNSRQTAAILGVPPNGSYKASDASLVPLIRMSNTVIAAGDRDPQDILREVDHGYYLVGHRIPSVAESRENFRISAMKVYEIRNGELGQLYRNGGIAADSKDFFLSIDAVGNDFRIFPIPNCGKGQPMQTKRLGNGGPTIRGRARIAGA